MVKNSFIEWGFWVQIFSPISMYISKFTFPNKAIGTRFSMQLGHTFPSANWQKEKRWSPSQVPSGGGELKPWFSQEGWPYYSRDCLSPI